MKRWLTAVWVTVAIAMAVGCSRGRDTAADAQAIQDMERQWNQDYGSKDADKLAAYYAEDAVLMAPGMAPSVGRESIRATIEAMVSDPALSLKFTAAKTDVAGSGDLGYTRGAYVMTMTDPQTKRVIRDEGSYVTTYRKDADGHWKAVADIASSEVLPGASGSM
jgi:uncharacterized protein (TIGR02246 family)